jgi:uncharacterized protein (DUF1501 family)
MRTTRRDFLFSAAALPALHRTPLLHWIADGPERAFVLLELSGGNDALNTVAPVADPRYRKARPTLALDPKACVPLGQGGLWLHPSLKPLKPWFAERRGCALTSVGYPEPDRSHFRSMDIWHTASTAPNLPATGWLGRAADVLHGRGVEVPALSVGELRLPLVLQAERIAVPSLQRLEDFALLGQARAGALADPGADDLATFLARTARAAAESSARLQAAVARYQPARAYPDTGIGKALALVARVVVSGFGTRLFHVAQGGYDTHAAQADTQAILLRDLAQALDAFLADLQAHKVLDRTLVLGFSEFGRRLAENQSRGTDHGAGGVMLALGPAMTAPVAGPAPDLERLDSGDLRSQADFRSVLRPVLEDWLGVPAAAVLGGEYEKLGFLAG